MISRLLALCLLVALGVLNVAIDYSFVEDARKLFARRPPPLSHYTWIEDDVPERMPLLNARPHVLMSIEESVRYDIRAPEASLEWLWTSTADDHGNVHMGPNNRFFVVALTHQQHCLRSLRASLDAPGVPTGAALHHAEHCLTFMREQTLCAADFSLEPGDAFARNYTAERVGGERECMDVEAFYGTMWSQWQDWLGFKAQMAA
ncbi:uncharacterized protein TRAVEDRAFT_31815 [Trametes versicolor FP-101664 SS1]|uniref:uncharacterized protein n=1 Tax=Trametes versicolor (strain FP-101664) TaxID=717944 RepID=UPI0004623DBA|nr:uncharacterized protein TRAVEDRAFT_31815 [Trametes versicolor FP-101664 SS1]EIW52674.1 hypothetical protein TRAVEDRAFT_31815 [Trametes versicolor FP-101664 SS1]